MRQGGSLGSACCSSGGWGRESFASSVSGLETSKREGAIEYTVWPSEFVCRVTVFCALLSGCPGVAGFEEAVGPELLFTVAGALIAPLDLRIFASTFAL